MIVTALPKLFKLSPGERVQRSSGQLVPLLWPQHIDKSRQRGQGLPVCSSKPSNPSRPVWPQVSAFYFNNVIIIWWCTDWINMRRFSLVVMEIKLLRISLHLQLINICYLFWWFLHSLTNSTNKLLDPGLSICNENWILCSHWIWHWLWHFDFRRLIIA